MYGTCICGKFADLTYNRSLDSFACPECTLNTKRIGSIRIPVTIQGVFVDGNKVLAEAKVLLESSKTFPKCTRCGKDTDIKGSMVFEKPYCEGCTEKAKVIVEIFAESYGGKK